MAKPFVFFLVFLSPACYTNCNNGKEGFPMKKLRIGVVGLGDISRVYLNNLKNTAIL